MDWARAKTILIVVFLAIDIFLGYMIIGTRNGNTVYIDSQKIQEVTDYLTGKGIEIKGEIPQKKTDMPSITVKYKLFNKKEITEKILSASDEIKEIYTDSFLTMETKDVQIQLKNGREFNYLNKAIKPVFSEIDEKQCKKNIDSFIQKLGIENSGMDIVSIEEENGYAKYVYRQKYRGYVIYNSRMEYYVNDNGISKANIVWFNTINQASKNGVVVSPLDALLTMYDHYKEDIDGGFAVLGIEQGYYFGTGAEKKLDTSKIEEGTAFPVWRINTNRGLIYINAYNKIIEGMEKASK